MGGGVAGGPMGAPTGIRNVKDLTQMPGNIKPTYANEDRLKRREGKVIIVGYVTKQGTLTGLRIAKSTGHRSLDLRAYQALKSWRFYPGQEGWVAIPFLWSIKGDAELMPVAAYSK